MATQSQPLIREFFLNINLNEFALKLIPDVLLLSYLYYPINDKKQTKGVLKRMEKPKYERFA